ncbi:unnamed protein product [Auanema sp. JU1783]|nr:unnamed protein product [Auanema sp. JU1783]
MLLYRISSRFFSKNINESEKLFLKIGDVRVPIRHANRPELVPVYKKKDLISSQSSLSHLKWLLQKDHLKQDVFLLGVPGSIRSSIVLQYLAASNREYEYLTITRDTTEADIKQRREIRSGRAFYTDLCAVRAALNGRVLVIDGVEKAERNVLPILNNLLENREMQLDDGRFLMHHEKYDELSQKYSAEELVKMGLERVSPDFHVIALGLPVPRFAGHTLDPPLRSRFQCRHVLPLPFEDVLERCKKIAPNVASSAVNDIVAVAYALNSQEELKLPLISVDNLEQAIRTWNLNPLLSSEEVIRMLYPFESVLRDTDINLAREFLKKFEIDQGKSLNYEIKSVKADNNVRDVTLSADDVSFKTTGTGLKPAGCSTDFVPTKGQEKLLADLAAAHAVGDFAIIGPKGSGKTMVLNELSRRLGFLTESMVLYQDMNSRELIQRRRMLQEGDTVWEDSQLVTAAKNGHVCVLDGAERVHGSALDSLSSLIHHRLLDLPNGNRLIGEEAYEELMATTGQSKDQLEERGVYRIPSSFRLVLIGDSETSENHWINDAVLSLVPFFKHEPLSAEDQERVINELVKDAKKNTTSKLVKMVEDLRQSHDAGLRGVATSLSFRKLIHIARRDALHDGELKSLVEKGALSRFLPSITKTAFINSLEKLDVSDSSLDTKHGSLDQDIQTLRRDSHVKPEDEALVPNVLFYDNEQHVNIMRDMARDFQLGSHLLLIGNQGVGKNKVTDRFLNLINRPRLYIQLHRDTTVESLTIQCTVEQGVVKYEDSALVKAARAGHVLVVDEADKAPLHVIAVLKSLLDTGTLVLGDGRKLQPSSLPQNDRTIPLDPEFRMIMLANRPGFPFLGNDLFGVLGDLFSVHTVDNPSRSSEIVMLRKYGPNVPEPTLNNLVSAFSELRDMADDGLLQYPYSTRELTNIVKHVNAFPNDPLTSVVKNVLDFDEYSSDAMKTIEEAFRKHGIPLGIERPYDRIFLSERFEIPSFTPIGQWGVRNNVKPIELNIKRSKLTSTKATALTGIMVELEKENKRMDQFSEQICSWQIPTMNINICSDGIFIDNKLVISAVNPGRLYVIDDLENTSQVEEFNISTFIPKGPRAKYQPRIRLSSLGDNNRVVIHEEVADKVMIFHTKSGLLETVDFSEKIMDKLENLLAADEKWRMVSGEKPLFFERSGKQIRVISGDEVLKFEVEKELNSVLPVTTDKWLLKYKENTIDLLCIENGKWRIRAIESDLDIFEKLNTIRVTETEAYLQADGFYSLKSQGFPLLLSSTSVEAASRKELNEVIDSRRPYYLSDAVTKTHLDPNRNMLLLDGGVVVSTQPNWEVPKNAIQKDISVNRLGGFLEAVDTKSGVVQYVPVPEPKFTNYHGSWLASLSKTPFQIVPWKENKFITLDNSGGIRSYELSPSSLGKSLNSWRQMIGEKEGPLRMEIDRGMSDFDFSKLDEPKLGKFDPDNTPHVGGNQWMGGTGGYNTAGLGGVGGPFRLDSGHDVHQMPEFAKQQVPEHLLQKAREIAKAEYAKKLKEIKMSEYDAESYNKLWNRIDKQAIRLKGIIDQLEAKKKERQWARHQTSGDFDDSKIIEGITGEKNVYRRRIEKMPEPGAPQQNPKYMKIVFDVSGSMYRFNGYDSRLQRSLEAALMVMTSLEGKEHKIKYDITGHSGDTPCINFVLNGNYPKNNKERLDILKQMLAHTQYCSSGDFTTEALDVAIKELSKEMDCDEKIVVLVSDANLERYGIRPKHISDIMNKTDEVNSFVIFIGSLGEQAEILQKALPPGKAFVCKNTSELPQIMQNIFASTLI